MSVKAIETRMKLLLQDNRLATFKNWVFDEQDACSALKMAEAGFHFIGNKNEPDAVQCFLCEKSLDGWEATDDPWAEHSKHSPDCLFAQLMSPEDSLTLYQFYDVKANLIKRIFRKAAEEEEKKLEERINKIRNNALKYFK